MRKRHAPPANGNVDLETGEILPMRAPERPRGTATLEEAKAVGRRLGEDEVHRRQVEGIDAEQRVEKAILYATWLWKETGRTPL